MAPTDAADPSDPEFGRPFEIDLSRRVCDRATRLARTLFGDVSAQVLLVEDGRVWRNRGSHRDRSVGRAAQMVFDTGRPVWIVDGRSDPRFADLEEVLGPPYVRFYAAAPIRLTDGSTPGLIAVAGLEPRAYNQSLAGRLNDLAEMIADEWERVQANKAREQGRQERDALAATFAAVVQTMPVSLVITDRDFRVLGCSPRWAAEAGLTADQAVGRLATEIRPAAFDRWRGEFTQVIEGETITADKVRYDEPDGTPRWVAVEMAPWRGADGEVGGAIVTTHNITSVVEALEAVARSEQRVTLALEIADIHVWEMDYARRELTKAGCEDTFFTEAKTYEDLYTDIYSTIDPRERPDVEEQWRRHIEEDAPYRPEYRVIRSDNREVWVSGACRLISDERGRPVRLIGAMQNITERKLAEEALRQAKEDAEAANRAKSAFLAAMSHEIRTPLNGVLGMAQAMAAEDLPKVQRERLEVVRQSGEALLTVLNNVLDLSKIEAGMLQLDETEFDIAELAGGAQAAFAAIADRKRVAFDVVIAPEARGVYRGDCSRVRQILFNLISNALKFTESGQVRVEIARDETGLDMTVSDTGIGIPTDRISRLFQKFEQVDASMTRRYGGTGLGLAISRELAERLGGSISVTSIEGRGSQFRVRLPLPRVSDARTAAATDMAAPCELGEVLNLRVLAAEDNNVNQLVLKTLLQQVGIDPFIVSDGSEAVSAWRGREWDLILMDVQMPVMDGVTAARTIRAMERQTERARTPIIALTANAMAHQVAEYVAAGMDGHVSKPIQIERLFAAMESALEPVIGIEDEAPQASAFAPG